MIRVVLAVLLSAAILATVLPAADIARSQRAATLVAAETEELAAVADRFARRNDAIRGTEPGASAVVEVRVPQGTAVEVERGRLAWAHGRTDHRVTSSVRLAGDIHLGPGTHRLRLGLRQREGEPVVVVRRFKSEAAATPSRVRSSFGVPRVSV